MGPSTEGGDDGSPNEPQPVAGFDAIEWRVLLNTEKPAAAQRVLGRISERLAQDLEDTSLEPYWKDPSATWATFRTPLAATSVAEAVLALHLAAKQLTHGVSTSGPQTFAGGRVEMSVYSTESFPDPGLRMVEATIRNFELEPDPS